MFSIDSKALVRQSILWQLESAYPATLPSSTILLGLKISGFCVDEKSLDSHLQYLYEKSFLEILYSELSHSSKRVKITAKALDYLDNN